VKIRKLVEQDKFFAVRGCGRRKNGCADSEKRYDMIL